VAFSITEPNEEAITSSVRTGMKGITAVTVADFDEES
jgi:hypothetical protein